MKKIFFAPLALFLLCGFKFHSEGIWDVDHRKDVYELKDRNVIELADSTLAMIPRSYLIDYGTHQLVDKQHLPNDLNLCPGERYIEQTSFAKCSAVFIGKDLILTAGHCLSKEECGKNEFVFVFGYQMGDPTTRVTDFNASEVYSCKQILASKDTDDLDFAVIQLDRPVSHHKPITLAAKNAKPGEAVFVLGHPSGLPLKFSGPAAVEQQTQHYFAARLDTFAGNSGSGVFRADNHQLVGVFVRGDEDYDHDEAKQCERVHKCAPPECTGEEATNIESIQSFLRSVRRAP